MEQNLLKTDNSGEDVGAEIEEQGLQNSRSRECCSSTVEDQHSLEQDEDDRSPLGPRSMITQEKPAEAGENEEQTQSAAGAPRGTFCSSKERKVSLVQWNQHWNKTKLERKVSLQWCVADAGEPSSSSSRAGAKPPSSTDVCLSSSNDVQSEQESVSRADHDLLLPSLSRRPRSPPSPATSCGCVSSPATDSSTSPSSTTTAATDSSTSPSSSSTAAGFRVAATTAPSPTGTGTAKSSKSPKYTRPENDHLLEKATSARLYSQPCLRRGDVILRELGDHGLVWLLGRTGLLAEHQKKRAKAEAWRQRREGGAVRGKEGEAPNEGPSSFGKNAPGAPSVYEEGGDSTASGGRGNWSVASQSEGRTRTTSASGPSGDEGGKQEQKSPVRSVAGAESGTGLTGRPGERKFASLAPMNKPPSTRGQSSLPRSEHEKEDCPRVLPVVTTTTHEDHSEQNTEDDLLLPLTCETQRGPDGFDVLAEQEPLPPTHAENSIWFPSFSAIRPNDPVFPAFDAAIDFDRELGVTLQETATCYWGLNLTGKPIAAPKKNSQNKSEEQTRIPPSQICFPVKKNTPPMEKTPAMLIPRDFPTLREDFNKPEPPAPRINADTAVCCFLGDALCGKPFHLGTTLQFHLADVEFMVESIDWPRIFDSTADDRVHCHDFDTFVLRRNSRFKTVSVAGSWVYSYSRSFLFLQVLVYRNDNDHGNFYVFFSS